MNRLKDKSEFLLEIARNTVLTIIFLAVYDTKLFLAPHIVSEMFHIAFLWFCGNIPTFLKMYLKKDKTNHEQESDQYRPATLNEKVVAAKEVKEILTVPMSAKVWVFVIGMGGLSYWYFTRKIEVPTVENIFTSIFLGVFFALVFVGLYLIIQDEKKR